MKTTDAYHKWVEWSDEDGVYLGKCPDLITGIHGDDPVKLYADLTEIVAEAVSHFEASGRPLPPPTVLIPPHSMTGQTCSPLWLSGRGHGKRVA